MIADTSLEAFTSQTIEARLAQHWRVLTYVLKHPGASRQQVADRTGIFLQSVCGRVKDLIHEMAVVADGRSRYRGRAGNQDGEGLFATARGLELLNAARARKGFAAFEGVDRRFLFEGQASHIGSAPQSHQDGEQRGEHLPGRQNGSPSNQDVQQTEARRAREAGAGAEPLRGPDATSTGVAAPHSPTPPGEGPPALFDVGRATVSRLPRPRRRRA